MKVIIKYVSNEVEKQKEMDNFKSILEFQNKIEIKAVDDDIETTFRIQKDSIVSITISK